MKYATHLARSLIQSKMMSQLLLTDSTRSIDLVTENKEGNLREFLNGEKSIELGLGFGESLEVGAVH